MHPGWAVWQPGALPWQVLDLQRLRPRREAGAPTMVAEQKNSPQYIAFTLPANFRISSGHRLDIPVGLGVP